MGSVAEWSTHQINEKKIRYLPSAIIYSNNASGAEQMSETDNCVRGTRTQPLICVGCSVHYWVSCAINKGGFFEIALVVVVDAHLPRFEAHAYVLPHFDELTHVMIRASSSVC